MLNEKQIKGTVEYAPWFVSNVSQEHLFSVSGVPLPICKLTFPGARNISEEKLVKASKQLTETDYSFKSTIGFARFVLFPLYREVGQLRAAFGEPVARFDNSDNCGSGVYVSMPVIEGPIYHWNKAEWVGNRVRSAAELDAALGMKSGEVANGVKLDKALQEVSSLYGRTGHLNAETKVVPSFDDAASTVSYRIEVSEGPQYKMGNVIVVGLSEADSRALVEKWKLKPGEIFNTTYRDQFLRTDAREVLQRIFMARQAAGKSAQGFSSSLKLDRQRLVADVVLEFKD